MVRKFEKSENAKGIKPTAKVILNLTRPEALFIREESFLKSR